MSILLHCGTVLQPFTEVMTFVMVLTKFEVSLLAVCGHVPRGQYSNTTAAMLCSWTNCETA